MSPRAPRGWIAPMLATLVDPAPLPEGWIYEPKLDGVRALALRDGDDIRLYSRNQLRIDANYPEVVARLAAMMPDHSTLDGEILASDPGTGVPSFARLQQRMKRANPPRALQREVPVEYWVFDCPRLAGERLTTQPWHARRAALERALRDRGAVRLTPVLEGSFEELYRAACELGMEGLMGKRRAAPYRSTRSRDWVKLKCVTQQEFVVIGWTEPRGSRTSLGALLLGYREDGVLRYGGKVGTGFTRDTLAELLEVLEPLERRTPPVAGLRLPASERAHWVRPALVVQIGFAEWTPDGRLRHPRFLGVGS